MLSRRQRLVNTYARAVQKPLLALTRPQWLARKVFSLNAMTLYRAPGALALKSRDHRCTECDPGLGQSRGTIFYIHGGAFVIGNLRGYKHLVGTLAQRTGMRGIYVDYRLAPEDPAPAALDDVTAAYLALAADSDTGPIAVVGDSAGGNIALALLHRLLANGEPLPASVTAISPVTDLRLQNPSLTANRRADPLVPMSWGLRGVTQYLAGQSPDTPEISPILGTFTGAPPVLIHTDTTEVLYDDARLMAEHLRAQGVDVTYRETTGLPHVNHLNLGLTPEADAAVAHVTDFITGHLP